MPQLPRIYFEGSLAKGGIFEIGGDQAHHLIHVLRIKADDDILVFTSEKREFLAKVDAVSNKVLRLKISEERSNVVKPWKTILVQAIPKAQKMDWVVEKATELGVDEIRPILTERVVKRPSGSSCIDRWRKIALSSVKQCHRVTIPEIYPVQDLSECLEAIINTDAKLVAALPHFSPSTFEKAVQTALVIQTVALLIGPEGDFTSSEMEEAKKQGWIPVSLGPFVLRSETAAIAGLAILEHELMKATRRQS